MASVILDVAAKQLSDYGSTGTIDMEGKTVIIQNPIRRRSWGHYQTYWFVDGQPLIAIGPHWPIFLLAYCGFWFLTVFMLHFEAKEQSSSTMYNFTLLVCFIQLISYLLVSIKNPGIANEDQRLTDEDIASLRTISSKKRIWFCQKCQAIQQPGTGHCQFCNVCIMGHDHHCPWTGKCIGKYNFTEFIVFVVSTFFMMATFISSTVKYQQ